jgi:hypothetical protein
VPGRIEAEDYDVCGQNASYYDTTTGNAGGAYRSDDVDIEVTGDTSGGYDVGWIEAGEWLDFTSKVTTSGTYQVQLRVAATDAQETMHVEVDGSDVTGAISIPNTGDWQSWRTVTSPTFPMSAGSHIIAASFDTGGINLNWMNFKLVGSSAGGGAGGCAATPWNVPGQIEAEDYDSCGQNSSYYDTTPGNAGGAYRNDDVDIEVTGDSSGNYDVGWIAPGEWLNYTSNVASTGSYQVQIRVAATADAQSLHFATDGTNVSGSIALPNTGDWQAWATVTSAPFTLTAGQHVLTLGFDTDSFNVNWMNIRPASSSPTPPPGPRNPGGPGGSFASCSPGGCTMDCSPPANDPLATGQSDLDQYDGCLLAGMQLAGMTDHEEGKLIKAQAFQESGLAPKISLNACGGQNCGVWAISAGSITGDTPPGPCGSFQTDPFTGQVDYSHSYGLFQSTPACEPQFAQTSDLHGNTCTPTDTVDDIPFDPSITFYCDGAVAQRGNYIVATQDTSSPLYAQSVFNPAYQIYTFFNEWAGTSQQGNANASGCSTEETWYLTMAIWNTGTASSSCRLSGRGATYVQHVIDQYKGLFGTSWPYPFP